MTIKNLKIANTIAKIGIVPSTTCALVGGHFLATNGNPLLNGTLIGVGLGLIVGEAIIAKYTSKKLNELNEPYYEEYDFDDGDNYENDLTNKRLII